MKLEIIRILILQFDLEHVKRVREYKYAKYYLIGTTLITLERTMHLAIILLLVKCRLQNH